MPFYAIEKLKNLEFQENLFKFSCFLSRFRSPHLTLDIRSWSRDSPFVIGSRGPASPMHYEFGSMETAVPFNVRIEKQNAEK